MIITMVTMAKERSSDGYRDNEMTITEAAITIEIKISTIAATVFMTDKDILGDNTTMARELR